MKQISLYKWFLGCVCLPGTILAQSLDLFIDSEFDYAAPDESFSQRIWVVNNSGQTAAGVDVLITTPSHVDIWAGSVRPLGEPTSGWRNPEDVITVSLGAIPDGAIRVITLPVSVEGTAPVGGTIEWKVDATFASQTTRTTNIVAAGGLQVGLSADRQAVTPGDSLWLTVHLANPGEVGVSRANLAMEIDENFEILFSTFPSSSLTGHEVSHSLGTLPAKTLQHFRMLLRLKENATVPGVSVISANSGGRSADEFGGSSLHVLAVESLPAGLTVETGEPFTFLINRLANGILEGATLFSHLPQGTRLWAGHVQPLADSFTSGWRYASGEPFSWNLPDIYAEDPFYIQFPVSESTAAIFARVQRNELVMGDLAIPADAPFVMSADDFPQLSLELTSTDPIAPGDLFDVWVHFGNPSAESTDKAILTLQMPADVTLDQASEVLVDLGDNLYEYELDTIRSGETGSIWLRLTAGGAIPDDKVYDFRAWLEDESFPVKTGRERLVLQSNAEFPLSVKVVKAKQLIKNSTQWLTDLEITNESNFPMTDLRVSLNVPLFLGFSRTYSVPPTTSTSNSNSRNDPVFWSFPFIESGETIAISVPWVLNNNADPGKWYGMQAVLTMTEGYTSRLGSVVTGNNDSDLSLLVQPDQSTVSPGGSAWLTATFSDRGQDPSANPSLELYLPQSISFADADIEPLQTEPYVRFNLGGMVPGDRGRLRFKVDVGEAIDPNGDTTIVGKLVDQNAPVNSALSEATLLVSETWPVEIQVSGHGDPASGRVRQMEVLVGNTSGELMEDLTIWFNVPPYHGIDPDFIQPFGGTGGAIGANIDYVYELAKLPPGEPFVLTLPFDTASADIASIYPTVVHVNSKDSGYARDTEHIGFRTGDLRIGMEPKDDFAEIGGSLDYRVLVGNTSNAERLNLTLKATIPARTTFVSATGGGIFAKDQIQWDIPNIPSGSVAYADFTVLVPQGIAEGGILQNEAFVSDSESPRNTARVASAIPVADSNPKLTMDVGYQDEIITHTLTNRTGLELPAVRYWFTMPDYARLATNTSISARRPVIEDLLNVVSDEPLDLVSEIGIVGNPRKGHLHPYTGVARSDQGYGVVRRRVVPFTDDFFPIEFEGLNPDITQMWSDAESWDGGWVRSVWYGWFLENDWPWILHAEHKWQYPFYTPFGLYLYDIALDTWLFTNQALYFNNPVFASLFGWDGAEWVLLGFYRGGVAPERWFYHYGPAYNRPINEAELKPLLGN